MSALSLSQAAEKTAAAGRSVFAHQIQGLLFLLGECAHRGIADGAADSFEFAPQSSQSEDSIHRAARGLTLLFSGCMAA